MAYEGSVTAASGLIPKNNLDFPLVNAHHVYVTDDERLDNRLNNLQGSFVRYDEIQVLNDDDKERARNNIGVEDALTGLKDDFDDIKDAIYAFDDESTIGEPVQGYWSNGAFTEKSANTGRKITLNGSPKVRISGRLQQYYDKYDFMDAEGTILDYKRKMDETSIEEIILDVPPSAEYVCVSSSTAAYAYEINVYLCGSVIEIAKDAQTRSKLNAAELDKLNDIEIEGYNKSEWSDVTTQADLNERAYVELRNSNTKIVIVPNNSQYKYAVFDVVPGEAFKTTGTNIFDMRPAIYADDEGNVLGFFPTQKVTTPEYITVQTTVPDNATKLYVDARMTDEIKIEKSGFYFIINGEEKNTNIKVTINRGVTLDTTVVTNRGGKIRQKIEVFNNDGQPNSAVLPRSVELYYNGTWKTIINNEDDNCPVQLSSGYLGAGHGYDRSRKITATGHGKSYADIGSEWLSGSDHVWLVQIVDENTLIFMGANSSNGYDTVSFTGTTFTHVSGAVNTSTINATNNVQYLITPIDKNHIKKILIDGITEITEDGEYEAAKYIDIVDEYDVINPQTIVSSILAEKPSGGYTENPPINTGSTFLHFSNIYRILDDGTMLLFTTLDNEVNATLNYWGATQFAQKSPMNAFGGKLYAYIPKLLEVKNKDLRSPFDLTLWNASGQASDWDIDATKDKWEVKNPSTLEGEYPPDRVLQLFTNENGNYVSGYAVGYLPIAYGNQTDRASNIGNALTFYRTKKVYFHLIDKDGANGNAWQAYTPFQSVVYRKPLVDVGTNHTDAYCIPCGDKCYLYVDYHSSADDRIKVPSEYVGKPMNVVEKSSNITVYGTIATNEIRIRATIESPNIYGYAVICIG